MQWEDDFYSLGDNIGARNDLDMYLFDQFNRRLFGFNRDNMDGDPFEILPFVVQAPVKARIVIARKSGSTPEP